MSEAIRFLHALAQALSTMNLYSPGHPATRRGVENLWEAVKALLVGDERPVFLFLGTAPVYNGRALHELREWQHSRRLAEAGVQRLEFNRMATMDELIIALERIGARLSTGQPLADEVERPLTGVLFGTVAVQDDAAPVSLTAAEQLGSSGEELALDLEDELNAVYFVRGEARRGVVARAEAEAVVRILGGLLDEHHLPQAAHSSDAERYHLIHPINTALLAMAAATTAGTDPGGRHRVGVIALFHDIGMCRLPSRLGNLDSLTPEERTEVETHTIEGARLLLGGGGPAMELAATVAFEHHLRPDGTGYPARRFRPAVHWASRLIGVCATFASLRSPRPYRPAWPTDRALRYLEEGAGTVFDAEAARLVVGVVRND